MCPKMMKCRIVLRSNSRFLLVLLISLSSWRCPHIRSSRSRSNKNNNKNHNKSHRALPPPLLLFADARTRSVDTGSITSLQALNRNYYKNKQQKYYYSTSAVQEDSSSNNNNNDDEFVNNPPNHANIFLQQQEQRREQAQERLRFAVIPKMANNYFFEGILQGCRARAKLQSTNTSSVECFYVGPPDDNFQDGTLQAEIIRALLYGNAKNWTSSSSEFTGNETIGIAVPATATDENPDPATMEIKLSSIYEFAPVIHGLAVSVQNASLINPLLRQARLDFPDLPIVTVDSDAITGEETQEQRQQIRHFYIGTNNSFFGRQIARAMESLHPGGGQFGIVADITSPNLYERVEGILLELNHVANAHYNWQALPGSPYDDQSDPKLSFAQFEKWVQENAQSDGSTVLISVTGLMMAVDQDNETGKAHSPWVNFIDEYRTNVSFTTLCGDASDDQLLLLQHNYVSGLVGQMPYDMGTKIIQTLWELIHDPAVVDQLGDYYENTQIRSDVIGTNVITHTQIPLQLPPIEVDNNLIGPLKYVGYCLVSVIGALSIGFGIWVMVHRNVRVVRVAQPRFLFMTSLGVLIMGSCIIPLSMDDEGGSGCTGSEHQEFWAAPITQHCTAICMSIPWLVSIGFTTAFSALYSKTRRVNRIFRSANSFGRVKVTERDVLVPFFILLTLNLIILLCWTFIDPMTYVRVADYGRDGWNRVISTRGMCSSENGSAYFLVPLALVNGCILVLANWQAYEARDIEAEFAETKYIAIAMASLLQAAITGIPVLFIVRDNPQAYYMVFTLLIFIICVVILMLIFVPKVIFTRQFLSMSPGAQKQLMRDVVGRAAKASQSRRHGSTPMSSIPNSSTPYSSTPVSSIPNSSIPNSSIPNSSIPSSSIPYSSAPPVSSESSCSSEEDASNGIPSRWMLSLSAAMSRQGSSNSTFGKDNANLGTSKENIGLDPTSTTSEEGDSGMIYFRKSSMLHTNPSILQDKRTFRGMSIASFSDLASLPSNSAPNSEELSVVDKRISKATSRGSGNIVHQAVIEEGSDEEAGSEESKREIMTCKDLLVDTGNVRGSNETKAAPSNGSMELQIEESVQAVAQSTIDV